MNANNNHKLREALVCIDNIISNIEVGNVRDILHAYNNIHDRIRIALAAPPRKCDLYTNYGDAIRAFEDDEDAESFEDVGEWLFCETEGGAE